MTILLHGTILALPFLFIFWLYDRRGKKSNESKFYTNPFENKNIPDTRLKVDIEEGAVDYSSSDIIGEVRANLAEPGETGNIKMEAGFVEEGILNTLETEPEIEDPEEDMIRYDESSDLDLFNVEFDDSIEMDSNDLDEETADLSAKLNNYDDVFLQLDADQDPDFEDENIL